MRWMIRSLFLICYFLENMQFQLERKRLRMDKGKGWLWRVLFSFFLAAWKSPWPRIKLEKCSCHQGHSCGNTSLCRAGEWTYTSSEKTPYPQPTVPQRELLWKFLKMPFRRGNRITRPCDLSSEHDLRNLHVLLPRDREMEAVASPISF